jgi:outer membrane lipoprotein carrier protein
MKKTICITILFSVFCGNIFSQNEKKLDINDKKAFEEKMINRLKEIKTLQCDFVQEKTSSLVTGKAVSTGILLYQSPSKLRWEYLTPTPSTLILNGNKAALLNKDGSKIGNDRMTKQLGSLIISLINGDGIKNSKVFSTEVFETDNQYRIQMTPVQKRLQVFYQSIDLIIDKVSFLSPSIIMNEKSGDKMIIYMNNKVLNKNISSSEFEIREE